MRLYLAVAVLLLAFVAYTEAQERTIEERFNEFGQQINQFGQSVAEKINTSKFASKAKSVFEEMKRKFEDLITSARN